MTDECALGYTCLVREHRRVVVLVVQLVDLFVKCWPMNDPVTDKEQHVHHLSADGEKASCSVDVEPRDMAIQ